MRTATGIARWGIALLLACGGDEPPQPPTLPGTLPAPCVLEATTCTVRHAAFAITPDAWQYGLDIDERADNAYPDNKLGVLTGFIFTSFGVGFTEHSDEVLSGGTWQLQLQTCAAVPEFLRIQVLTADSDPLADVPAEGVINGQSLKAQLGAGPVPIGALLDLSQTNIPAAAWYRATAIKIEATRTGSELDGVIGGAFPVDAAPEILDEWILRSFNTVLAADPGCPDNCTSTSGFELIQRLDTNKDRRITIEEFANDPYRTSGLYPDVDLTADFEGTETFWPNTDGINDHFSFGLGFHADNCSP